MYEVVTDAGATWLVFQDQVGSTPLVEFFMGKLKVWEAAVKKNPKRPPRQPDEVKDARGKWVKFDVITKLLEEIKKGGTCEEAAERVEDNKDCICLRD